MPKGKVQIICQVLKKCRGAYGPGRVSLYGRKTQPERPRAVAADAEGVGLGLAFLSRRVRDGTAFHVQSCMLRHIMVHTLEGACCHGLCAEFSVFLPFACYTVALHSHLLEVPSSVLKK